MIVDQHNILSDGQAITATAASTNVIDLGASTMKRDVGKGTKIPVRIQVVEAFNNATSITFALQVCAVEGFGSGVKTVWSSTVALADLKAGAVIVPEFLTRGTDLRFMRLNYTVTGTAPTTGKVFAGVVGWGQSNE